MPLYEYECSKCGRVEEAFQRFSDKPLSKCRHCSGKLQKLISQSAFHLKGSGWYVTDYANKSKTSSSKPQKAESAPSDSGTSSTDSNTPKDSAG
jgi:putative FmdB family regulatory protein